MRFPTFVDKRLAGEVLEDGFEMAPRFVVAAKAPIEVEGSEKRTAATLAPFFVLLQNLPFTGPTLLVESARLLVRLAVSDDEIRTHGASKMQGNGGGDRYKSNFSSGRLMRSGLSTSSNSLQSQTSQ